MTLDSDFIPAASGEKDRLMVVLHGLGDSMEGYRWLPRMLGLPWLNYLLVNAPDEYYGGYSWYDFAGDAAPGIERSRTALFQLLDTQIAAGYRPENIFIFGFSQGCLMTTEIGARYSRKLAGLIGISGYAWQPEDLVKELSPTARAQRFLITHGTNDPLIPLSAVRPQIALLKQAGLNIEWHEFRKEHTIEGEAEIAIIRQFIERCRS